MSDLASLLEKLAAVDELAQIIRRALQNQFKKEATDGPV